MKKKHTADITIVGVVHGPDCATGHNYYAVTVDAYLLARIKLLSGIANALQLYCCEQLHHGAEVFERCPALGARAVAHEPDALPDRLFKGAARRTVPCDCMSMCVCSDIVYWQWFPRHSGDDQFCKTDEILIDDIENYFNTL